MITHRTGTHVATTGRAPHRTPMRCDVARSPRTASATRDAVRAARGAIANDRHARACASHRANRRCADTRTASSTPSPLRRRPFSSVCLTLMQDPSS
ncbi:hypothetical protein WL92_02440 [Burkholderia multivorans]|nr:hypothetical protein WL91_22205 [Burkholderia multivorans]KWF73385.1 hypothetical protein WL92_02440 [Burkholderia multivorans]